MQRQTTVTVYLFSSEYLLYFVFIQKHSTSNKWYISYISQFLVAPIPQREITNKKLYMRCRLAYHHVTRGFKFQFRSANATHMPKAVIAYFKSLQLSCLPAEIYCGWNPECKLFRIVIQSHLVTGRYSVKGINNECVQLNKTVEIKNKEVIVVIMLSQHSKRQNDTNLLT